MKYILILLFTFISITHAKEFSIIINKDFNEALFDITQNHTRTLSAVGFTNTFVKTPSKKSYTNAFDYLASLKASNTSRISIVTLNKEAEIIMDKAVNIPEFAQAVSVIKTPQDGYFIGGHTSNGQLIILKLNANYQVLFKKVFGTKNKDTMNKLISLRDGGILCIGTSNTSRNTSDKLFESGLGLNDILVTRFTKDGRKLWSNKYGTTNDDKGIDGVEANDGSLLILSSTAYKSQKDISVLRLTNNGSKIWIKKIKEENKSSAYKIIKLNNNNFLLSLTNRDELQKEQIRLIKLDIQSNVLADKEIQTAYSSVLNDIKEYTNGNLIGVGYIQDTYNTDGLVMILDTHLNMLHQEHYGDENYDTFKAVHIMHNSLASIAGLHTHKESQESNMWVLVVNKDATLAQVSTRVENIYIKLVKLFQDEIKNKKIKIKKDLSIEFIADELLFKQGKYKITSAQKEFLISFSSKLISFIYTNKEYIHSFEVNGHTSSEWKHTKFQEQYLQNKQLSMQRSYAIISHIFKLQNKSMQVWLSQILRGSGFGFSKKIVFEDVENKKKSRRVSFKLIL